ncbi:integral membrane protein [Fusarium austroafricanum]|uniref:Integral membrane protein n=1 Tax=Fusarium austroafricanum TaxID=2364996 RepID=A0A8H4KFZ9_9HYPO|nr:integral membrane protein [Fusarium austroafricanum]
MGVGRFFCVLLPFALTVGSIIFLLVGALAGVADKSLYIFRINVANLSINPADVDHIIDNLNLKGLKLDTRDVPVIDVPVIEERAEAIKDNITAKLLGLDKYYDINLWGFCKTDADGKRKCEKPEFDWANKKLNTSYLIGTDKNVQIELPKEIQNALKAFKTVTKWTQVVFIAAFIALAAEIILGIFSNCSRIFSCLTWIVAGLASTLVIGAVVLSGVFAGTVVGAVEGTAKFYGVKGNINGRFFACVAIAAAFALAAGLFWLFTICCCKPEHRSRDKKNRRSDGEKLLGTNNKHGSYAPLSDDHEMQTGYYNHNQSQSQYGAPRYPSGTARSDLAYEPYSHRA